MTPTPKRKDIDLLSLDEGDLESLQTQDAFVYHSIPGIHKTRLSLREVNHTEVLHVASQDANTTVSRKTRVSTEGNVGLVFVYLLLSDNKPAQSDVAFEDLLLSDDNDDVPIPPAWIAAPTEQIVASSEVYDGQEAK